MSQPLLKLSKAKIALGRKLAKRLAKKYKAVPIREPRYDEVYYKGLEWLNKL